MHEIYSNIKYLRQKERLSQSELASKVGYADKGMISRIENGKIDLPLSVVEKFAEVFHCSSSFLLGYEDEEGNIERPITSTEFDQTSKEKHKTHYNTIFESMGYHIEHGVKDKERYYLETGMDEYGDYHRRVVLTEEELDLLNKEIDEYIYFKVSRLYEEKSKGGSEAKSV